MGGVSVRALRIRHNPTRRYPEQHVGFLVGDAVTVLHVGDADPTTENFSVMKTMPPVDVGIVPFWYVLTDANRRLLADTIRPRRTVAMHLPPADIAKVTTTLRQTNVSIQLATDPGSPLVRLP